MGVEVVMVWLEGILHHSDKPPAFLQVPCHVRARLGSTRRHARQSKGQGDRTAAWNYLDQALVIRHPPARTAPEWRIRARVRRGVDGGRDDYRIKVPISTSEHLFVTSTSQLWLKQAPQLLTACASRSVQQLAAVLCVSFCRDPRRLISKAPDLSLLALSWRTMAPFLCPEV